MGAIGIDQVQHRPQLANASRELRDVTAFFERVAFTNDEPVGDLLEEIAEALVVRPMRVVLLADEQ